MVQETAAPPQVSPEQQSLLQELLAMVAAAEVAPEPRSMRTGTVVDDGSGNVAGVPMATAEMTTAGHVYVYHTETGDRSIVNLNMLPAQLQKRLPTGKSAFSIAPTVKPRVNTVKCLLHADDPNRALHDELGLPVCPKSNLPNVFHRRRHMEHRHSAELAAIKELEDQTEREANRRFQRELLTAASSRGVAPVVVEPVVESEQPAERGPSTSIVTSVDDLSTARPQRPVTTASSGLAPIKWRHPRPSMPVPKRPKG